MQQPGTRSPSGLPQANQEEGGLSLPPRPRPSPQPSCLTLLDSGGSWQCPFSQGGWDSGEDGPRTAPDGPAGFPCKTSAHVPGMAHLSCPARSLQHRAEQHDARALVRPPEKEEGPGQGGGKRVLPRLQCGAWSQVPQPAGRRHLPLPTPLPCAWRSASAFWPLLGSQSCSVHTRKLTFSSSAH